MNLFWLEYLHFIVAIFAILVSVSAATLFLLTYRTEAQLTTVWRAVGFSALAAAFFLFILERKFGGFGLIAIAVELFGFFGIYKGVTADLNLSKLREVPALGGGKVEKSKAPTKKEAAMAQKGLLRTAIGIIIFGAVFVFTFAFFPDYLSSATIAVSIIFILATIRLQIRRFRTEGQDARTRRQNLWPLLAYVFLLYRAIAMIFFRLPDLDVVLLRQLQLNYSIAWQLSILFGAIGFILLGIWAWTFIRVRVFLRTYVVFLTIAIVVSSLGSLVFSLLVFRIVEDNNLELMLRGAQTEQIIAVDKQDTALFVARTIATNPTIVANIKAGNHDNVQSGTEGAFFDAGLDTLRVYNTFGEVIASPGDDRERGQVFNEDVLVSYVLSKRSHIKSFDRTSGVLSDVIVARAVHPVIDDGVVIGAVEAAYTLDNAFVDFSKEKTGLDVTVYTGDERSATTITTLDGVSRWVGSKEGDKSVLEEVIERGQNYAAVVDRLGIVYYSAYVPVRDVNGVVIGMVSVGTPTIILFEDTRQQLVTTFLIVTIISLLAAMLGYVAIRSFRSVGKERV